MKKTITLLFLVLLSGCATFNDAVTPKAQVKRDAYDGTISVFQDEVSAASSLSESWTFMGFAWYSKDPEKVEIYAGIYTGWLKVSGVRFKIEDTGEEITANSDRIEYNAKKSGNYFSISIQDFEKITNADSVLMKLEPMGVVSSFGKKHDGAVVTAKLKPFLEEIEKEKQGRKIQ
jgi:hypothetical protein